jgi:hypothetical protein
MNKEDAGFLGQLVQSLEDAAEKLEKAYEKKDYDSFNRSKKIMLNIQKEISGILK